MTPGCQRNSLGSGYILRQAFPNNCSYPSLKLFRIELICCRLNLLKLYLQAKLGETCSRAALLLTELVTTDRDCCPLSTFITSTFNRAPNSLQQAPKRRNQALNARDSPQVRKFTGLGGSEIWGSQHSKVWCKYCGRYREVCALRVIVHWRRNRLLTGIEQVSRKTE